MHGHTPATSLSPLNHTFSFRIGVAFASFATPQKCLDSVWFRYVELALFLMICFLLFAACRFLLPCRVLQGFWHSFTALHPCTWFVQLKCLIKRELSTLDCSLLYLPLSHSLSLSLTLPAWKYGIDVEQKTKYSISSTMKLRISPCKWTAKYDLYATLVGSVSWPVGGMWMRFCHK